MKYFALVLLLCGCASRQIESEQPTVSIAPSLQSRYVQENPHRPSQILKAIEQREKVAILGMTKVEVWLAWGSPLRRNTSSSGFEVLVYDRLGETVYLDFQDDTLISWQTLSGR